MPHHRIYSAKLGLSVRIINTLRRLHLPILFFRYSRRVSLLRLLLTVYLVLHISIEQSANMPGGAIIAASDESERVEAPTTWRAYLMCVFASFGGIYFGYDSGYINGVMGMNFFITQYTGVQPPGPNASQAEIDGMYSSYRPLRPQAIC